MVYGKLNGKIKKIRSISDALFDYHGYYFYTIAIKN